MSINSTEKDRDDLNALLRGLTDGYTKEEVREKLDAIEQIKQTGVFRECESAFVGIPSTTSVSNGTDQIADHFAVISREVGIQYSAPGDAIPNWLPNGYRLVTDPAHVLKAIDCLMPSLGTDWRLVSSVNGGARIGLRADQQTDVRYIATPE